MAPAPTPSKLDALRREIAQIEARKPLNRPEALAVIIRQAGGFIPCGCGCGEALDPLVEGVRDEHVISLGVTGTNELHNREFWRLPCSKAKDKRDAKDRAKARRLAGETCQGQSRPIPQRADPWPQAGSQKLQSRGFDTRLSKKMDGSVVRREP